MLLVQFPKLLDREDGQMLGHVVGSHPGSVLAALEDLADNLLGRGRCLGTTLGNPTTVLATRVIF